MSHVVSVARAIFAPTLGVPIAHPLPRYGCGQLFKAWSADFIGRAAQHEEAGWKPAAGCNPAPHGMTRMKIGHVVVIGELFIDEILTAFQALPKLGEESFARK